MLHSGSCLAAASLLMLSGAVGISSVDDDAGGQDDGDNSGDTSGDNSGDTSSACKSSEFSSEYKMLT